METKLRLDRDGNPYLVVSYNHSSPNQDDTVESAAERIFIERINLSGGTMHVMGGTGSKANTTNLVIVANSAKRKLPDDPSKTLATKIVETSSEEQEAFPR